MPRFFVLGKLEYGIDALFFGVINKAAGIDNDDVRILVTFVMNIELGGLQLPHQHFTVYRILAATQCNDIDFGLGVTFGFHDSKMDSTKACLSNKRKSSAPSPKPTYLTGIWNSWLTPINTPPFAVPSNLVTANALT